VIVQARIDLDTWLTLAGAVFTAAAAAATFVAVIYAQRTVKEARKARSESHAAHEAEMQQMEQARVAAATQANWLLGELKAANKAADERHQSEVAERESANEVAFWSRMLAQLQRVNDQLFEYVDAARAEATVDPGGVQVGGRYLSTTRLHALYQRLRVEVVALREYGGPDMVEVIPPSGGPGSPRDNALRVWTDGIGILTTLANHAQNVASKEMPQRPDYGP
jgi:hypothetical protein